MKKYLLFVIALFSLFVVNTKAAELPSSSYLFKFLDKSDVGFTFGVSSSLSQNGTIQLWNLTTEPKYSYFVLDFCTTGWDNFSITNNGYNNYFNENFLVYRTGQSCSTGNYTGVLYRLQLSVGKYIESEGDGLFSASYIHFIGSGNYHEYKFISSVLSDTDILSSLIASNQNNEKQQEIIDKQTETNSKLDDVKGKQDQTNSKLDEAENTRKGILGTIKDVLSNIINLPKKIVEFLVDALKSLFVPTDDQLYEIVNDSKELSENFGFVGEAVAFFLNIFTGLLGMVNANGCIEMPAFKIGATSLFDEHTFWEARNVCLADNLILNANITTIRSITSIVFVSLFLGFATRKFFSILSKSENEVNSE